MPEETQPQNSPQQTSSLPFPLDRESIFALKKGGFILAGTATLVSGTVTISDPRIQTGSIAIPAYASPSGTTGTNLKAVAAQGSLTITAINTSRATVTTDVSKVSYLIIL